MTPTFSKKKSLPKNLKSQCHTKEAWLHTKRLWATILPMTITQDFGDLFRMMLPTCSTCFLQEKEVKMLQQALQGMQQQLLSFRTQSKNYEQEITKVSRV